MVVIYGSVRSARQGIRAARWVVDQLERRDHEVHLVDPVELELPMLDRMYKEYAEGEAPPAMRELAGRLVEAEGFVIVSGEYNHGIPPALKNLLDHYQREYHWRPAAIVTYSAGPFGGVRALINMRAILAELGTPSIPTSMPISRIGEAFDATGEPLEVAYIERTKRLLDEFEWYCRALKRERDTGLP